MAEVNEPIEYNIRGNNITCPICRNDKFWMRKALLNNAVSAFFNIDWADKSATCLVCSECTHITWFAG